jgi:HK97 family phage major capsid protein
VAAVAKLKRGYANGAKWAMNNATLYNRFYGLVDENKRPISSPTEGREHRQDSGLRRCGG